MNLARLYPWCDRPGQSLLAAFGGGLVGGLAGLALGFGPAGTALLAGLLGGLGDVGAHLVVRDSQFKAALETVSNRLS